MAQRMHLRLSPEVMAKFEDYSPEERIRAVLAIKAPNDQRFSSKFIEEQCQLREVKVLSDKSAIVTFAFKVDVYYCNASGNLHGGAQSSIFDMCTSIALQAIGKKDFWLNGGVTRVITVNCWRPAPEGEDLLLECEVVQMGRNLALTQGVLKREKDGVIVSTCEHHKAAVPTKPGWKL
ncbi:hypothetical protein LTR91_020670 [Friedmanniomyces endolithicus]|uniref:Thioesterase domain-containing protein n=1 Tax=Friedmanniomyces endolithicus TaxID=329885 RepID=A0AAN6H8Y5_9PEZI|nr:hypothetical protein LTR57_021932 [Friedmanniomyces endolithicus]KAK0959066.1 hypothetical protein LTS01_021576 [Friedmanniomyces endolithicus]KAK0959807.1 hypothetical protein LTR91_020670 [Friedmanniomyces endolithicus]KAK1030122.1 hypothetical protein LTS16_019139 [Friedmanniomyces endolithicus]